MLERISEALERIRAEEVDYEILRAASGVIGRDVVAAWRPSLSYVPPKRNGDEYHVTVSPGARVRHARSNEYMWGGIEPKVRALVGAHNLFVHDYFDMFDWASSPVWAGD